MIHLRFFFLVIFTALSLFVAGSCLWAQDWAEGEGETTQGEERLIYIDEVMIPPRAELASGITVTIYGAMPDPSWGYEGCSVQVEDFDIIISAKCKKLKLPEGVQAVMVIVPVVDEVTVMVDEPGVYRVVVRGYQLEAESEVEVRE